MNLKAIIFAVSMSFLGGLSAQAQTGETPPTLEGAKTVTTAEVKALLGNARIVDVRRRATFLEGHLPGAISIVNHYDAATKTHNPVAFGEDKSKVIVVYGHGTDGWSAVAAVNSAVAAGFTKVHWMRAGWAAWTKEGLPTAQ